MSISSKPSSVRFLTIMVAIGCHPLAVGCFEGGRVAAPTDPDATVEGGGAVDGGSSTEAAIPDTGADEGSSDSASEAMAMDAGPIAFDPDAAPPAGSFCALPGSVVWTDKGPVAVPAPGIQVPDMGWLHLPVGFCAHYFATVLTARQLRFAPGGELFVASPSTGTTGGAGNGISGIVVLPDDDHDGFADSNITFLSGDPSVQGLMFNGGYFYYQVDTVIKRVAYSKGDRQPSAASEVVTNMRAWPQASEHWPRAFDVAQDGTFYITNGGSQGDTCQSTWPVRGGVFKLEVDGGTSLVASGFRNPIDIRCEHDHDVCLAVELALDYSALMGGREKLVAVRKGDNWGYPCCASQNLPFMGVTYSDTNAIPDCGAIPLESEGFIIGETPFGVDFETGRWPAPWSHRAFVTVHGVVATWEGARVVGVALDPDSGLPLPTNDLGADAGDAMRDFATGWDDMMTDHGRPAPITFAPDGRLFIGDDQLGAVVWIAPTSLMVP
jgi:glucose/arabinose dehydrogenase